MREEEFRRYQSATAGYDAMATVSTFLAGVCFTSLILIIQQGDSLHFQPVPSWMSIDFAIPLKASELTLIPIMLAFVLFMFSSVTFGMVGENTGAGFSREDEANMINCIGRIQIIFYIALFSMFAALVLIALTVSFLVAVLAVIFLIVGWVAWLVILSPLSRQTGGFKRSKLSFTSPS